MSEGCHWVPPLPKNRRGGQGVRSTHCLNGFALNSQGVLVWSAVPTGVSVGTTGMAVGPDVGVGVGFRATMVTSACALGITMSLLEIPGLATEASSTTVDFPAGKPLTGAMTVISVSVSESRTVSGPLTITLT